MMLLRNRRSGFALLAALLLLLLIELLAAALLAIGTRHRTMVRAQTAAWRARSAAEAGVRLTAAAWDPAHDTLPPGALDTAAAAAGTWPDGTIHGATIERLPAGGFLLDGEGIARDGARGRALARLATTDALRMWLDLPAAITTGSALEVLPGAIIDGATAGPPPGWGPAECPAAAAAERQAAIGPPPVPAVLADSAAPLLLDPTATLIGTGPVARAPLLAWPAAFDGLGALRTSDLARLADHIVGGTVSPAPSVSAGACDTLAATNWGDPLASGSACAGFRPLVFAPNDLHLSGGSGQGVLVIAGDLVITGAFEYRGVILVSGRIDASAPTIHGALRIGFSPTPSRFGGYIRHDECALWRAFHSAPLRRPFRLADRWWMPAF